MAGMYHDLVVLVTEVMRVVRVAFQMDLKLEQARLPEKALAARPSFSGDSCNPYAKHYTSIVPEQAHLGGHLQGP